jgi:cobalt/nickel transport system permease protein
MQPGAFDRYVVGSSLLHRLDPRVKLVATVLFILSNTLLPDGAWHAFALAWGLILAASALSGLGPGYTLRRSFVALPFALVAVSALFALPGRPLFALTLGPWDLVATDAGLVRFASIVVRTWLSVQLAILLVATTRFPDLVHALRALHVPAVLVAIVSLMYRYLHVLAEETTRLLRAREARSARLEGRRGGGSLAWRARVAGSMAGQLFLRSYERSDRVYNAMLARGYQGQMLTLSRPPMQPRDWVMGAMVVTLLALLQLVARLALR